MINRFILEHSVLMKSESGRSPLNGKPIENAKRLLRKPPESLQQITMRSPEHIAAWAEYMIQENFGDISTPTSFIERRLMRCVMLHMMGQQVSTWEHLPRYAIATIGSMLQRDLTILLLEIHWEDWHKILSLTNGILENGDNHRWHIGVIGAAASATVAHTLMERPKALVLLPTPFEDVNLGIDLYWHEAERYFCVSVKSRSEILGVQAELIRWDPHLDSNREKILGGTRDASEFFGTPFRAVLAEVGRQKLGESLPMLPDAKHWPEKILHDSAPGPSS